MSTPILFIIPQACSFGSLVTLDQLQIPYQVCVTTPAIRASEAFLKINPLGRVGALKDGNQVIYENLAILLTLADKNADKVQHQQFLAQHNRSHAYQWLSYISTSIHPPFSSINYPSRFAGEAHAAEYRELSILRLIPVLNYVEQSILPSGYLIHDKLAMVDAQAYGLLRWLNLFDKTPSDKFKWQNYPRIQKFFEKVLQHTSVKNALAIELEQTQGLVNSSFAGYHVV